MLGQTHNGVDTGHLLADHEQNGNDGTLAVAGDGPHLLHEGAEGGIASQAALRLKLLGHLVDLVLDVLAVGREATGAGQDDGGALPVVLAGAPTGGLGGEEHAGDEQDGGECLEGKRDDEDGVAGDVEQAAVVDPEGQHNTDDDEELVDGGQATADGTRGALGDVERHEGGGGTDTETSDEAADVHHGEATVGGRGGLQNDAEEGEETSGDETEAAAEAVGGPASDEAGGETTGLEGRDDVLVQGDVGLAEVAVLPLGGLHGEDAADGTRLPAEEHTTPAGGEDEVEDTPVVDLIGILLHGIVAHDGAKDLGGGLTHGDGCVGVK